MTFANRSELVTEVEARLRRPDQTARTGGFIRLAEAEMNRKVRARRKVVRAAAIISDEFSAVPDDFGGARTYKMTGASQPELRFLSPEAMAQAKDGWVSVETGQPVAYAIVGDEFEYFPVPDGEYTGILTYYSKLPALVEPTDSNWLLADHPDAYLAGALWHGFAHLKNADLASQWKGVFDAAIEEINAASVMESMGGMLNPTPNMSVV